MQPPWRRAGKPAKDHGKGGRPRDGRRTAKGGGAIRTGTAFMLLAASLAGMTLMAGPLNPFLRRGPAEDPAPAARDGEGGRDRDAGNTAGGGMFQGDAASIADEIRSMLDSPSDGGVDSLATLLYRHGDTALAEAREPLEAAGRQEDAATVRSLAREWHDEAMDAATAARRVDLKDMADGARKAALAAEWHGLDTGACAPLAGQASLAARTAADEETDYQELTDRQVVLGKTVTACATGLAPGRVADVFGEAQGDAEGDGL